MVGVKLISCASIRTCCTTQQTWDGFPWAAAHIWRGWEDGAGALSAQESQEGKKLEELRCACMRTGITSASDAAGIASRILSLSVFVIWNLVRSLSLLDDGVSAFGKRMAQLD